MIGRNRRDVERKSSPANLIAVMFGTRVTTRQCSVNPGALYREGEKHGCRLWMHLLREQPIPSSRRIGVLERFNKLRHNGWLIVIL